MILHRDSHTDHVSQQVIEWLLARYAHASGFMIHSIVLTDDMPDLECGLYGPRMGDMPVDEDEVYYDWRGARPYPSRMIARPMRKTRILTFVCGPHDGHPCVLYTAFGGPQTPKEPLDPTLKPEEKEASRAFWDEHALASRS